MADQDGTCVPASDDDDERLRRGSRPGSITCYPDGPLLVRGDVLLIDADGRPLPRRRKTVALCRCGKSALTPFCDGTHKLMGFRPPGSSPEL